MTLKQVAAKHRSLYPRPPDSYRPPQSVIFDLTKEGAFTLGLQIGVNQALDHIESDPDFKLRGRIEELAKESERLSGSFAPGTVTDLRQFHIDVARRLRTILEAK